MAAAEAGAQGQASQAPQAPPPPSTGTFLGGIPTGTRTETVPTVTILDAMNRALQYNLGVVLAQEQVGRAQGTRKRELSALLPNVAARLSESQLQNNLQAFGFTSFGPAFGDIPT